MARFTWDEAKRNSNLRKHGLDFADARELMRTRLVTREDDRYTYAERRYASTGMLHGRMVTIVYTEDNNEIRVISLRRATRQEIDSYYSRAG